MLASEDPWQWPRFRDADVRTRAWLISETVHDAPL